MILVAGVAMNLAARVRDLHRASPGSATPVVGVTLRRRPARVAGGGRRPRSRATRSSRSTAAVTTFFGDVRPSSTDLRGRRRPDGHARRRQHADGTSGDGDGHAPRRAEPRSTTRRRARSASRRATAVVAVFDGTYHHATCRRRSPSARSETVAAFGLILGGLGDLVGGSSATRRRRRRSSGPVGIATQIGDVFWQRGPDPDAVRRRASCRPTSPLVNILPFPPLDGGRML